MVTINAPTDCPATVVAGYFERAARYKNEKNDPIFVAIWRDCYEPDWLAKIEVDGKLAIVIGAHWSQEAEAKGTWYFHS